ncbi:uncharacterized protein RHO25_011751 [Cercospora beticola]|nr:hypothetical protein RHO25_011751 [Cercospora beticola]
MPFHDEVDELTSSIREANALQVRTQFPYMGTATLEKLLDDSVGRLKLGILQQESEVRVKQSRSSFMSLSAELRNMIYEMALCSKDGVHIRWDRTHMTGRHPYVSLVSVNRQIREESLTIWYGMNTFKHTISWLPGENANSRTCLSRFGRPENLSAWLKEVGANVALIKTIELTLSRGRSSTWLTTLLRASDDGLLGAGLTVHQTVLHLFGLLDAGLAAEVFQMKVDVRDDFGEPETLADFYEVAGIDGQELFTRELLDRLE